MKKVRVRSVEVEDLKNLGCNNGNYPTMWVWVDGDETPFIATTCRCGNGCSGNSPIPRIGQVFASEEDLMDFLENED